ncbi:UbiA family prenyltransferase [Candidatus Fermentibacteria bacterium]|nr:UbiA family prenyltransferase [Candidatus Fermentibacteria bacterium]
MIRLLTRLEYLTCPWQRLVGLVASVIFLRGILEGVLEREHLLGIRAVPGVSQSMLFLHFPAFYAAAFLLLVLLMHRWSGRPVTAVAITTAKLWPLTLLPPVLDALLSGGRGYDMSYLGTVREMGVVLKGFFTTSTGLPGVTPGMRVEIALACLGVGIYAGAWQGAIRGLAGAVCAFFGLMVLGSLPLAGGVGAEGWMHIGGFGNLQSHRFAIVNMLATGVLALAVWHRASARTLRAWMRGFRWLRSLMYGGLTGLGVWVIFTLQRPWITSAFSRAGDWLSVVAVVVAQVLCFQSAALSNDLADEPWDGASPRRRALWEGMGREHARVVSGVLALMGLALALCVQYAVFLIMLAQLVLAAGYSWEPIRLKRIPLVGTAVVAMAAMLAVVAGAAVIGREWVFQIVPWRFLGALWVSFFLGFGIKDIADEAADRAAGVWSFPVAMGPRAVPVLACCALLSFAVFPVLSGIGALLVPGMVLGVVCAVAVVLRRVWSERAALLILLIALLGIAVGVARDRVWLHRARGSLEDFCEALAVRSPESALAVSAVCPGGVTPEVLPEVWPLAGLYPWLLPRVSQTLEPSHAAFLLGQAAAAGVCPGLAASAGLEPLMRIDSREQWCLALAGAVAGGREDGSLIAAAARHADAMGLAKAAAVLRDRGIERWPGSAAVWAELARAHLAASRPREALESILHAQTLDPASADLQRDVRFVRKVYERMMGKTGEVP